MGEAAEKDMRTSELVENIHNFLHVEHHVSIKTRGIQFGISVATAHGIIYEDLNMLKICAKFLPRMLRDDMKEIYVGDSKEIVDQSYTLPTLHTLLPLIFVCYPSSRRTSGQLS